MSSQSTGILARGPWRADQVTATWREAPFFPTAARTAEADRLLQGLMDRGSPSHDGMSARLAGWHVHDAGLHVDLQPMRWSLRLSDDDASDALSVLCVVRAADGRWLAGRRADWVATWAGRWALGAGGAVDVGEDPVLTLTRELEEEWSVVPAELLVEALVRTGNGMIMLIGSAWLAPGAEVVRDHEHDEHAWWPADPSDWPADADATLRATAAMLHAPA